MGMNTAWLYGKSFDGPPEPADYIDAVERIEHDLRLISTQTEITIKRKRHHLRRQRSDLIAVLNLILVSREVRDAHRGIAP